MLTNNYYAILANSYANSTTKIQFTNRAGNKYTQNKDEWGELNFGTAIPDQIIFGTGTTHPTRDDYTLSGTQITELEQQSVLGSYSMSDDGIKITKSLFMHNTGTEDITVGEIGWTAFSISTANFDQYDVLLDRTLLEEPITIPVGGTAQINYSIFFKYGN